MFKNIRVAVDNSPLSKIPVITLEFALRHMPADALIARQREASLERRGEASGCSWDG